jgi:hypothetical protein
MRAKAGRRASPAGTASPTSAQAPRPTCGRVSTPPRSPPGTACQPDRGAARTTPRLSPPEGERHDPPSPPRAGRGGRCARHAAHGRIRTRRNHRHCGRLTAEPLPEGPPLAAPRAARSISDERQREAAAKGDRRRSGRYRARVWLPSSPCPGGEDLAACIGTHKKPLEAT